MLGFGRRRPVSERRASGETERIFHEIEQTFRVTGINLEFRTLAGFDKLFPVLWEEAFLNVETLAFEEGADHLRAEAVQVARALGRPGALEAVDLGESERFRLRALLALYHYVNPKLLLFTSALSLALRGVGLGAGVDERATEESLVRGVPPAMHPMEMVDEEPDDPRLRAIFDDIRRTLDLPSVNSDYRSLALFPDYLAEAWPRLKSLVGSARYQQGAAELRATARTLAKRLPYPIALSRARIERLGEDPDALARALDEFERILPALIVNVARLALDFEPPERLERSPFPAATRPAVHFTEETAE